MLFDFVILISIILVIAIVVVCLGDEKPSEKKAKILKILFWTVIGSLIAGVIAVIVVVILFFRLFPPAPPTPEVTYGEFPFRLEYEIDGVRFIIEDTLVTRYTRSGAQVMIDPAFRIWETSYLDGSWVYEEKGRRRGSTRLKETDDVIIRFHSGHGSYFMDDWTYGWFGARSERNAFRYWRQGISFDFYDNDIENFFLTIDQNVADVLYEYGIILIDWWYAPPMAEHEERVNMTVIIILLL